MLGVKTYQYLPLQEHEIRLVKLLPVTASFIKCEIVHVSLHSPGKYTALSYAWGDAENTRTIEVRTQSDPYDVQNRFVKVPVTISLRDGLRALRKRDQIVMVWADALCIDQQNPQERAQQVRLMTAIYQEATSLAIWLGPTEDDSDMALESLEYIASHPNEIETLIRLPSFRPQLLAIASLFEREYWRRLWIVQKVLNTSDRYIYCGFKSPPVAWNSCLCAARSFQGHGDLLIAAFPKGTRSGDQGSSHGLFTVSQSLLHLGPRSIEDIDSITQVEKYSLLGIIRACRRKLCVDPRDKIFGILGVLPDSMQQDFHVDYSLSVREVYIDVVDYILHTTRRLDVICESIHFPHFTGSIDLPSWTPDWSHITNATALGHIVRFTASRTSEADFEFPDHPRRRRLAIRDVYVDTIVTRGIPVGTLVATSDYLLAFLEWRALLLDFIPQHNELSSEQLQQMFCETICLGNVPDGIYGTKEWLTACYRLFASLIRYHLPKLALDDELENQINRNIDPETWFMTVGDIVVVPLGCSTPIILRPGGRNGDYRFVGDAYIHGWMHGRAIDECKAGRRWKQEYVLY
ncbi:heterokaryon incompatibility protein-domain-containing protein [Lophiotrema nucula]|uniref:Heterokaryon incompatibility protein-domain-containing protein n=1 Tax=Lophiotrema nucula TaxID=690887 RepID=A0A6A5Z3G4_9PLEO|nr:heterokaryon incompatibility protein-domain-containing protein [Lophiotrema nucula]